MDLLILCCFGGLPFIEFSPNLRANSSNSRPPPPIRHQWDPTDWVAMDLSGSLLNASANSDLLATNPQLSALIPPDLPEQLSLEQCDLWNLTFASAADEHLFRSTRAQLKCRCSPERFGSACQQIVAKKAPPSTLYFISSKSREHQPRMEQAPLMATAMATTATTAAGGLARHENSFAMFLLVFMLLAAAMIALFLMLRGCCFCDCFGGFGRSSQRRFEEPLDPQAISHCLQAVQAHEAEEKRKWAGHGQWNAVAPPPPPHPPHSSMVVDLRRPLLPQQQASSVPSVSESVPIAVPAPRACSPPPSYRSLNASLEQLPSVNKY